MQKSKVEYCKKYGIMISMCGKTIKNEIFKLKKFHAGAEYEKRIFDE
ncbi:hypothetical protein FBD77_05880 [Clostridium butyricum]|nr:hypothetical protein [Clostridium butyricum]